MAVKIAIVLACFYLLLIAIMALTQTRLLFPAQLAAAMQAELPPNAQRLTFRMADGVRLQGLYLPAQLARTSPAETLILAFGGNAWNAETLALFLRDSLPSRAVVAFHYRGYAPSEGWPSAKSLMQDAVALHDLLVEKLHPAQIVALGISIGSGPAAYLSRHRRIAGAVLITPFDSLTKLAGDLYWWAPVRLLLRHRMEVASLISTIEEPVAIIAAAEDRIVPPARTNALRKSVRYLVFDRTISGAGHNDIYDHPQFASTLDEAVTRIESRPRDQRSKTQ